MALFQLADVAMNDDEISAFCARAHAIFRAAGTFASRMELFPLLPIDHGSAESRLCWARTMWYVFNQIYTFEYDVTQSYQPCTMQVPGLLPISPPDVYLQPRPLKEITGDKVYKMFGQYWIMGTALGGRKSITSTVEFVRRREVTGVTTASRGFCARLRSKRDPLYLRYLVIKPLYPSTSGQWKFWKDALVWVISNFWGVEFRQPVYVHLHPDLPDEFRCRLEWVLKEYMYRAARKKERKCIYTVDPECNTCT